MSGVDLAANQDEETDQEVFQLEMLKDPPGRCAFRTADGKYWNLNASGGVQSDAVEKSDSCYFQVEWQGSKVTLKASNGKYVNARRNGQLSASVDLAGESELFAVKLINRPLMVLRGEHGFIGCRKSGSGTLDSNRAAPDVFKLERSGDAYSLRDGAGRYWQVSGGAVSSSSDVPVPFQLELCDWNRLAIRTEDGFYLRGDQTGALTADTPNRESATLWEY
ncbi:fascin-like [Denticeps clupeoides]|uniref:fascin-like n=1 Tax=Denticeps clupeoides TaxID=299321 RepID=UPI0010A38240|nr:fascin-like [Denticeps clupeoides]